MLCGRLVRVGRSWSAQHRDSKGSEQSCAKSPDRGGFCNVNGFEWTVHVEFNGIYWGLWDSWGKQMELIILVMHGSVSIFFGKDVGSVLLSAN